MKQQFFENFKSQNFSEAADIFAQLNKADKEELLKQLYYQARETEKPIAVSVLYRKLHEGKTLDDFYEAWMPPQEYLKSFTVGNKVYHQFFETPVRILNAVNREDPTEIISVGIIWCKDKEQFEQGLDRAAKSESNAIRHESISEVADHVDAKIYDVKTDTNLGT